MSRQLKASLDLIPGSEDLLARRKQNLPAKPVSEKLKGYDLEVVGDAAGAHEVAKWLKQNIKGNACDLSRGLCEGNLGIPRSKMPQVEADRTITSMFADPDPEVRAKADAIIRKGGDPIAPGTILQQSLIRLHMAGVRIRPSTIEVGGLKATQRELDAEKVLGMADSYLKGEFPDITNRILISADGYIVDGHHRWAALLLVDPVQKMNVVIIDLPIRDILQRFDTFPGVYHTDLAGKILD